MQIGKYTNNKSTEWMQRCDTLGHSWHQSDNIIMMVADGLVTNKHQAFGNQYAASVLAMIAHELYHINCISCYSR